MPARKPFRVIRRGFLHGMTPEEQGHDMEHIEVPGRPGLMKEGAYRIKETPLLIISWQETDSRKITRTRSEALMDVVAVINEQGAESTKPMALWMRSRGYEQFVKLIDMIGEYSERGYDEHNFIVHVDEHSEVKIHKG